MGRKRKRGRPKGQATKKTATTGKINETKIVEEIIELVHDLRNTYIENLKTIRKELISSRIEIYKSNHEKMAGDRNPPHRLPRCRCKDN